MLKIIKLIGLWLLIMFLASVIAYTVTQSIKTVSVDLDTIGSIELTDLAPLSDVTEFTAYTSKLYSSKYDHDINCESSISVFKQDSTVIFVFDRNVYKLEYNKLIRSTIDIIISARPAYAKDKDLVYSITIILSPTSMVVDLPDTEVIFLNKATYKFEGSDSVIEGTE